MSDEARLTFWLLVSRPSYWLYRMGLPNGYGSVTGKVGKLLLKRHMLGLPDRGRLPHMQ